MKIKIGNRKTEIDFELRTGRQREQDGSDMIFKAKLLSEDDIGRTLVRMAHQIIEKTAARTAYVLSGSALAAFRLRSALRKTSKG